MSDINQLVQEDLTSNLELGGKVVKSIAKNVPKADDLWKQTLDGGIKVANKLLSTSRSIRG